MPTLGIMHVCVYVSEANKQKSDKGERVGVPYVNKLEKDANFKDQAKRIDEEKMSGNEKREQGKETKAFIDVHELVRAGESGCPGFLVCGGHSIG